VERREKKAWEEMDQVSISASQFSALTSPKIGMLASGQFSLSLPFFFSSSAMALSTLFVAAAILLLHGFLRDDDTRLSVKWVA
jgi:hypothetical protein